MANPTLSLVKAQLGDWQKVLEFEQASKSKFFAAMENEKEVKGYLAESEVFLIKAENDFIGTVSFKSEGDSAYMDGLTIAPQYRGKGFAKLAFSMILEKTKGFKRAYVRVHPKNTSAIIIYLKEGFEITAWENNHYGDGEPRLLMGKNKLITT